MSGKPGVPGKPLPQSNSGSAASSSSASAKGVCLLPKDLVQASAQFLGYTILDDRIASALARDVEFRLREVLLDASKFMRHSRRTVLTTQDFANSLKMKNYEGIYGYPAAAPTVFRRAAGTPGLVYREPLTVNIVDLLETTLPTCPVEPSFSMHWLAVDGVQPDIPQNQVVPKKEKVEGQDSEAAAATDEKQKDSSEARGNRLRVIAMSPTVHAYFVERVQEEDLAPEMQTYFQKVVDLLKGKEPVLHSLAISSLREDTSLQPLVPHLANFVAFELRANLDKLPIVKTLLRVVEAVLHNKRLQLRESLSSLIPTLMTVLLSVRISQTPWEDHWTARNTAALLLSECVGRFSDEFPDLKAKVVKTFLSSLLDAQHAIPTHYGAICGLSHIGGLTAQMLLFEPAEDSNGLLYMQHLQAEMEVAKTAVKQTALVETMHALARTAGDGFVQLGKDLLKTWKPIALVRVPSQDASNVGNIMYKQNGGPNDLPNGSDSNTKPQRKFVQFISKKSVENNGGATTVRAYERISEASPGVATDKIAWNYGGETTKDQAPRKKRKIESQLPVTLIMDSSDGKKGALTPKSKPGTPVLSPRGFSSKSSASATATVMSERADDLKVPVDSHRKYNSLYEAFGEELMPYLTFSPHVTGRDYRRMPELSGVLL